MRISILIFILSPFLAHAATDEKTKVACLDQLARYEFTRTGEILPDSHWYSVILDVSGSSHYEWDGKKIYKHTIGTDPRGFTSTSTKITIWTRLRAKYNPSGLVRKSNVSPEEMSWVLNALISQTMSQLHSRINYTKYYRGFSIAQIVDTCGEVSEARVKMRRKSYSASIYRKAVRKVFPRLFTQ